jgi:hypothetical protein
MKHVFTPEAEEQADECDRWWREHRDTRDRFARELAAAKTLPSEGHIVGPVYTSLDGMTVRRVLLRKTKAHLYYATDRDADLVTILAVWGAPRGRGPHL